MVVGGVDPDTLPDDPKILKSLIRDLICALQTSESSREDLAQRIAALLTPSSRRGSSSHDQHQLLLGYIEAIVNEQECANAGQEDVCAASGDAPPSSKDGDGAQEQGLKREGRPGHGRRPRPNLPERTERVALPEGAKCSRCGCERLHQFGSEVSYRYEFQPASLYLKKIEREKVSCRRCEQVMVAEMPPEAIPKGLAGPGLLAHVITSKYCDHVPLHRQCQILKREGVSISEKTVVDWVRRTADLGKPVVDRMSDLIRESVKIHTDDTPVKTKQPGRRRHPGKKRVHKGRIWVYVGGDDRPYTVFEFTPTHEMDGPMRMLQDYQGYVQADAYRGYDGVYEDETKEEVGCMAHARRYFEKAEGTDPVRASLAKAYIRELYDIEKGVRDLDDDARKAIRDREARPILDRFKKWLDTESIAVLPKSPIFKAIAYARGQWKALEKYLEHGALEIDNNIAERALRGLCIGRRNWLFFGSNEGGERAAVLLSLVASCKRHGIDPFQYLRDLFTRLPADPTNVDAFLPDRWTPPTRSADSSTEPAQPAQTTPTAIPA